MRISSLRPAALLVGAILSGSSLAGAMTRSHEAPLGFMNLEFPATGALTALFKRPQLIAVSGQTGGLEAWPIALRGGQKPRAISPPLSLGYASLAANGSIVAAAMQNPRQVLLYDVKSKSQSTLPDAFGLPSDIAIGRDASIYVVNFVQPHSNVVWYPKGSGQGQELTCRYFGLIRRSP
jgi:hypothetical protein